MIKKINLSSLYKKIFILALFFAASLIIFFNGVEMHERVHQIIFKDYGIESTIHATLNKGYTLVENRTQYEEQCTENCILAHHFNEVVGYNLDYIYGMIFLAILIYILIWRPRED